MFDNVSALYIGTPKPLKKDLSVISAMEKSSVLEMQVLASSISNDDVANTIHHGGVNRVIHHYPLVNYGLISEQYPQLKNIKGSMGENISSAHLTDENVCIGDVFTIGDVKVLITEPRKPCRTIDSKYQVIGLARFIQEKAITGWFYRVLNPGMIKIGDEIKLIHRPHPELSIRFCVNALLNTFNKNDLAKMLLAEELSENWKRPAREIIETGIIPDDKNRLGS